MKVKTIAVELELVRYLAELDHYECPWCIAKSWYGDDDHTSSCPIAALRHALSKGGDK